MGILMAGWAHCGKTAALLGFASMGAEYVGEEWVLLNGNGEEMHGLVRPLEISRWHFGKFSSHAGRREPQEPLRFPWNRHAGRIAENWFPAKGFEAVLGFELAESVRCTRERCGPAVAPSAIFQDRIRSAGAQVDKIFWATGKHQERRFGRRFPGNLFTRLGNGKSVANNAAERR